MTTGGMDRANLALAQYLSDCGYEVHVVAHRVDVELAARANVFVHRVPKPLNSCSLGGVLLRRAGELWAVRIAERGGCVVVNGGNCNWAGVNWVHYVHAAYEPTVNGSPLQRLKSHWTHRAFLRQESRALQRACLILANSERTRQDLIARLGIPPDLIQTVYYGTDRERFHPATPDERAAALHELSWDPATPFVAFVGSPDDRRKGFATLFKAWVTLCSDARWDANLAVVGHCADLPSWTSCAEACGVGSRILFLGFRQDVHTVLAGCSCVVAPTHYEAFGLGVQEGLCRGLPAVVSENSGVAEIFPSALKPLLLPDSGNVDCLVRRLWLWRSNMADFQAAAVSFSQELLAYSWDQMAARIVTLIEADRP